MKERGAAESEFQGGTAVKIKILGGGTVVSRAEKNRFLSNGAVAFDSREILEVGETEEIRRRYPKSEYIDAKGGYIMPAFINPHEHCYSALSRGMALRRYSPRSFMENLRQKWWNLDRSLTQKQIMLGAQAYFIDAVKNGVTTEFEHNASYGQIKDSLSVIAEAAEETGIRVCACFEVSDRWGEESAREAVRENLRWYRKVRTHQLSLQENQAPVFAASMGLHASFTLSDKTLEYVRENMPEHCGCHIHIAESEDDEADCRRRYKMSAAERLKRHGLLDAKTIIAHGVHLSKEEIELIRGSAAMVVNNPESNMNNAVGCPPTIELMKAGVVTGLGMDGFTHDMFLSWRIANALYKHAYRDINAAWKELPRMVFEGNAEIAERYFGKGFGKLEKGAVPDMIVVKYNAPAPVAEDNIDAHMLFGMNGSNVRLTICGGKTVAKDGEAVGLDEEKVLYEAEKEAEKLWERF